MFKKLDSPSLVIFKDKIEANIHEMIRIAGSADRLMPHIKTNKMQKIIEMMVGQGITRFKAATIAEAELAAMAKAKEVLIAHQLVGPKINRFFELQYKYPETRFSTLVDCKTVVDLLQEEAHTRQVKAAVYVDINNGMNRSGLIIDNTFNLFWHYILSKSNLEVKGFHVYDGHIKEQDLSLRQVEVDQGFGLIKDFLTKQNTSYELIAGGTPTFTSHSLDHSKTLSPGTCVLWDWGYGEKFSGFEYAAFILTRVISKPISGIITVDMGHKGVGAENPIGFRIKFLQNPDLKLVSQSEEHGVLETNRWEDYEVGDVLLGVPYHICPTVNLYDVAYVFERNEYHGEWEILGRKRKINI